MSRNCIWLCNTYLRKAKSLEVTSFRKSTTVQSKNEPLNSGHVFLVSHGGTAEMEESLASSSREKVLNTSTFVCFRRPFRLQSLRYLIIELAAVTEAANVAPPPTCGPLRPQLCGCRLFSNSMMMTSANLFARNKKSICLPLDKHMAPKLFSHFVMIRKKHRDDFLRGSRLLGACTRCALRRSAACNCFGSRTDLFGAEPRSLGDAE